AMLAILVFEAVLLHPQAAAWSAVAEGLAKTTFIGLLLGLAGAWILVKAIQRHLVPDYLENIVTLSFVVALQVVSNTLAHEAGLVAVTVMGMALASQRLVPIRFILEF